jgi:hypothetical protein
LIGRLPIGCECRAGRTLTYIASLNLWLPRAKLLDEEPRSAIGSKGLKRPTVGILAARRWRCAKETPSTAIVEGVPRGAGGPCLRCGVEPVEERVVPEIGVEGWNAVLR